MKISQNIFSKLFLTVFSGLLFFFVLFVPIFNTSNVSAIPEGTNTQGVANSDLCMSSLGPLGWLVCPTTGKIAEAADWLYQKIEDILVISPISTADGSPIYEIWKYCRGITNIVFIIFLLVVIYSQITGLGISNYGIKKSLPKLIIAAILVNLSFIICSLAVEVSNIVGVSLRGLFESVETASLASSSISGDLDLSYSNLYSNLAGGTALAVGAGFIAFETGAIWMLIPVILGAIVAVASGLITIAFRQAIVALLIMISPLAFVAYMLPNTENLFKKWKQLLTRMLVFYPMFSLLFGASHLAGWAIIVSAKDGFAILLGVAVQVFPLFFSWTLMRMSGTVLGTINSHLRGLAAKPLAANRTWADSHRAETRARSLRNNATPFSRLMNYLDYRKGLREYNASTMENERTSKIKERVYNKASSYRGAKNGLDVFEKNPNKYSTNTKRASVAELRASVAKNRLSNVNSAFGSTFSHSKAAKSLGSAAGEAFKDYAAQEFLTVNNAQADEDFLLGEYVKAANNRFDNGEGTAEYNRLVKNAAGDLGLLGESSILGQTIDKNARTETRRRAQANIVKAKFGYDRAAFHSSATGVLRNADGYAIDRDGNVIEDSMFRLKPGKSYVPWDKFEYDYTNLDANGNPAKINYFDIVNDKGQFTQRVYANDNGYMKELLIDDIMIGDPVNRLYEMSAGIGDEHSPSGALRKYYSTIAGNITTWKDHSGGSTPMLAAMIRNGTLNSVGKFTIGYLQSLKAATKASAFMTNDKFIINDLNKVFVSAYPELFKTADNKFTEQAAAFLGLKSGTEWVPFEYYIPDQDINDYLDVKKNQLEGLRFDESSGKWNTVGFNQSDLTFEDKKNFVIHDLIPGTMKKLFGLVNRKLSPNLIENQKPPTADALSKMLEIFNIIGQQTPEIYDATDPTALKRLAEQAKNNAARLRSHASSSDGQSQPQNRSGLYTTLNEQISHAIRNRQFNDYASSFERAREELFEILNSDYSFTEFTSVLADFVDNSEGLDDVMKTQIANLISDSETTSHPTSSEEVIHDIAHANEDESSRIEDLKSAIEDLFRL